MKLVPRLTSFRLVFFGFAAGAAVGVGYSSWTQQEFAAGAAPGKTNSRGRLDAAHAAKTGTGDNHAAPATASTADLSRISPQEARKVLDGITDPEARKAAIRRCLSGMPREKWKEWIEGTLSSAKSQPHKADFSGQARRYTMLTELFNSVAAVDPIGFMTVQNSKGQRNNDAEQEARLFVMMHWAEVDPKAAKAYLAQALAGENPPAGMDDSAKFMAGILMRQGEPGMLEWAGTLPEDERGEATGVILSEIAAKDFRQAAKELDRLGNLPGLNTGAAAMEIAKKWGEENRQEALNWAATLAGTTRRKAMESALGPWTATDFDAALKAVQSLPREAVASGLAVMLNGYVPDKTEQLAQLVEQQPEGPGRADASAKVMSTWTSQNPEAASLWMQRQPRGEIQDSAITAFIRWADVRDPEAALLWAGSISDSAKRMDAVEHIIGQLGEKAPAAVQPWLESNTSLTASERGEIQQKLQRGR